MDDYSILTSSYFYATDQWYVPLWVIVCVHIVLCIFAVVGNLMVILAYIRDSRIRQTAAYTIILNLSVTDIMVGLFIFPTTTVWWIYDRWIFGRVLCKLWLALDYSLLSVSTYTVVFISLDRYWLVTKGLAYPRFQTTRLVILVLAVIWAISLLFYNFVAFIVPLVSSYENEFHPQACELEVVQASWFNIYGIVVQFIVPFSALVVLNYIVYNNIRRRSMGLVTTKRKIFGNSSEPTLNDTVSTAFPLTSVNANKMIEDLRSNETDTNEEMEAAEERLKSSVPNANVGKDDSAIDEKTVPGGVSGTEELVDVGENGISVGLGGSVEGRNVAMAVTPVNSGTTCHDDEVIITTVVAVQRAPQAVANVASGHNVATNFPDTLSVPGRNSKPASGEVTSRKNERRKHQYRRDKAEFKRHRKAAITLASIVIVYCMCFLPYYIYSIIVSFCKECVSSRAWEVVSYLQWSKSTINPFIYGFTNVLLRRNFARILSIHKCSRGTRVSPVTQ